MYSRSRGGFSFLPGGGATPLTIGILTAAVILYVVNLATKGMLTPWLVFHTDAFPARFWTLFTWPFLGAGDPISFLFALGWTYWFAGSMERAWGTRDFGVFFLLTNIVAAIGYWLGSLVFGPGYLAGLWIAIAPVAVAWALTNRGEIVSLFFIPIPGIIWGIIGAATAWFYAGPALNNPLLGLTALAGCVAAYVYTTRGRYGYDEYRPGKPSLRFDRDDDYDEPRGRRPRSLDEVEPKRPFNVTRWWRERQEKKRLEEIFRRSGFTDDDERR